MKSTVDLSPTQPLITMTRIYDAPREMVWEAFTNPEHLSQWFGGDGFTSPVCEMDLRPGGAWRHVLRAPNGFQFEINSIFLEVEPPELLSWKSAADAEQRPQGAPPSVVQTVTLEEVGAQTRWRLVARYATMADREMSVGMGFSNMVSQGAERLADFLQSRQHKE